MKKKEKFSLELVVHPELYWGEYLRQFSNEERIELAAVKRFVEENDLYSMNGSDYQNGKWVKKIDALCPKFKGFSLRAWGAFMAAIMNSKEKKRKYDYIDYAWW